MYVLKHIDENTTIYERMFSNALIDNPIDIDTISIILNGHNKLYIEEVYDLHDILNAEFKIEDKYCYIEDVNGGFVCFLEDKEYFLKEYEDSSSIIEGSKKEVEDYLRIHINEFSVKIPKL